MLWLVIFTFIALIFIRNYLAKDVETVDALYYTPSDFAVIADMPAFSVDCDYSVESIQKDIEEWLGRDHPEVSGVEYVNVAYDIENIFELLNEEREWLKKREMINWYIEKEGWTIDDYKAKTSNWEMFKDFPT